MLFREFPGKVILRQVISGVHNFGIHSMLSIKFDQIVPASAMVPEYVELPSPKWISKLSPSEMNS